MTRFVTCGFVAVCAALVALASAPRTSAAPVPKDAGKNDPTPDLKTVFDVVERAVKDKKWPKEDDEKILRGTAQVIFERMLIAAERKGRGLPVAFKDLKKHGPVAEFTDKKIDPDDGFIIARTVEMRSVHDAVIFASEKVDLTSVTNCIIFAPHVHCVAAENCLIVAGDDVEVTSLWRPLDSEASVVLAGKSINATAMDGTVCHVLHPVKAARPDPLDPDGEARSGAITANTARGATFLNPMTDVTAPEAKDCKYITLKNPIAKVSPERPPSPSGDRP